MTGCAAACRAALGRQLQKGWQQRYQHHRNQRSGGQRRAWAAAASALAGAVGVDAYARWDRLQMRASPPELPLTYDPAAFAALWDQHICLQLARVGTIASRVLPFLVRSAWVYHSHKGSDSDDAVARLGVDLRLLLVDLGPTFIKFGQMLSIRPDLLPASVLMELQKLCDAVPAFPTAEAIAVIESEFGRGAVARMFDGLDESTEPIAAASLGQVYRVHLREKNQGRGTQVAVKVQRPDMVSAVSLDLLLLRRYMHAVEAVKSALMFTGLLAQRKQFDIELLDSFASASFFELDYEHEAANQQRFLRELKQRNLSSSIRVPHVHHNATSRRVLTTEWIEGKQLAHSSPATIRRLVPSGVRVFLVQLLDMGFFHSDPHPGNLLVDAQGRLVLVRPFP
jgi:predicted unusual protein kinase regulating ubiquinone biosynthesis (AarF/ABC1/UbiB family)